MLEQDRATDGEITIILDKNTTLTMIDVMVILIIKEELKFNYIHNNNLLLKTDQVIIVLHNNRIFIILKLTVTD